MRPHPATSSSSAAPLELNNSAIRRAVLYAAGEASTRVSRGSVANRGEELPRRVELGNGPGASTGWNGATGFSVIELKSPGTAFEFLVTVSVVLVTEPGPLAIRTSRHPSLLF